MNWRKLWSLELWKNGTTQLSSTVSESSMSQLLQHTSRKLTNITHTKEESATKKQQFCSTSQHFQRSEREIEREDLRQMGADFLAFCMLRFCFAFCFFCSWDRACMVARFPGQFWFELAIHFGRTTEDFTLQVKFILYEPCHTFPSFVSIFVSNF
jgi:hypothetical protein